MQIKFSETNAKIVNILSRIVFRETGNMNLACLIGSWGDTLEDEEILEMLEQEEEKPTLNTYNRIN